MKGLLRIAAGGAVVLGFLAVAAVAYFFIAGPDLDRSSKAYVDTAIPKIVAAWSWPELEQRASPEYVKELKAAFSASPQLGALKQYQASVGEAEIQLFTPRGIYRVEALYYGQAIFENGPAYIAISLVKVADQWQITGFKVHLK